MYGIGGTGRINPEALEGSLEVIDDAGVFVTDDQPLRVAAAIDEFLASTTAVAAARA